MADLEKMILARKGNAFGGFMKYMEDRGKVELVHNFTFENLRFIR